MSDNTAVTLSLDAADIAEGLISNYGLPGAQDLVAQFLEQALQEEPTKEEMLSILEARAVAAELVDQAGAAYIHSCARSLDTTLQDIVLGQIELALEDGQAMEPWAVY